MTPDQIAAMPAGREMDRLIGESICGFRWFKHPNGMRVILPTDHHTNCTELADGSEPTGPGCDSWLPKYSAGIIGGWEVVERLNPRHSLRGLGHSRGDGLWRASFWPGPVATGETPELAICRAALLSTNPSEARNEER